MRAHADVGAVERIAAGVMGAEGAAAGDLLVGVPVRVVVKLYDQRGGVADHFAVRLGQKLAFGKGGNCIS
jgi:hypothetical protein